MCGQYCWMSCSVGILIKGLFISVYISQYNFPVCLWNILFSHCFLLLSLYLLTVLDSPASFCFKVTVTSSMVALFSSCPVCTLLFLNNLIVAFISLLDLFPCLYWVRQFMLLLLLLLFNFIYSQCCIRQMGCHMFVVNINIVWCICYMLYTFYSWHFCVVRPCIYCAGKVGFVSLQAALDALIGAAGSDYSHTVKAILYLGEWMNFFQKSSPIYCPLWV